MRVGDLDVDDDGRYYADTIPRELADVDDLVHRSVESHLSLSRRAEHDLLGPDHQRARPVPGRCRSGTGQDESRAISEHESGLTLAGLDPAFDQIRLADELGDEARGGTLVEIL